MNVLWDIDTQIDFMMPEGKFYVKGVEDIRHNLWLINTIIVPNLMRNGHKIAVAGSVDTHAPKDPEFKVYPEHAVKGTPGWMKVSETLHPNTVYVPMEQLELTQILDTANHARQGLRVMFEKNTPDVGVNKNVKPFLEDIQPTTVYVYGVVTEICVKAAVEYLTSIGFDVKVITDAIKEINMYDAAKLRGQWNTIHVNDLLKVL
jgi:nicotinamidase/pyrazinamidase